MKNQKLRKTINQKPQKPLKKRTIAKVQEVVSTSTPVLWEKPFISSSQQIKTENGVFHYELVLRALADKTVSRVKLCPVAITKGERYYSFFPNPIDKVCICCSDSSIVIEWKELMLTMPVLFKEELNPEEQFSKHLVLIENYIDNFYLKEVYKAIENSSQSEFSP